MLRITTFDSGNHVVTLQLEGRLVGPWVDELRSACEPILQKGRMLKLDLLRVGFADAQGLELLAQLRKRGAALDDPSPFLEEEMKP